MNALLVLGGIGQADWLLLGQHLFSQMEEHEQAGYQGNKFQDVAQGVGSVFARHEDVSLVLFAVFVGVSLWQIEKRTGKPVLNWACVIVGVLLVVCAAERLWRYLR